MYYSAICTDRTVGRPRAKIRTRDQDGASVFRVYNTNTEFLVVFHILSEGGGAVLRLLRTFVHGDKRIAKKMMQRLTGILWWTRRTRGCFWGSGCSPWTSWTSSSSRSDSSCPRFLLLTWCYTVGLLNTVIKSMWQLQYTVTLYIHYKTYFEIDIYIMYWLLHSSSHSF